MSENFESNQGSKPDSDPANHEEIPVARPVIADSFTTDPTLPVPVSIPQNDMLLQQSTSKSVFIDAILLCVLMFAFEMLMGFVLSIFVNVPPDIPEELIEAKKIQLERSIIIPVISVRAVAAIFFIWAILRYRQQKFSTIGMEKKNIGYHILIGIVATPVVAGIIIFTMKIVMFLSPEWLMLMEENANRIKDMVPILHPVYAALLSLIVAVYEELIFRGFLLSRIRRLTQNWTWAVILTTILFTSLHAFDQTAPALIMVTLLSLSFSLMTIWRRSLWPAIITHALWDWSQFLILYYESGEAIP